MMYSKVIVAVDGSESSQKALQEAKQMLLKQAADQVEIVCVVPTFKNEVFYTEQLSLLLDPVYAKMLSEGEELLKGCAAEMEGLNVKTTLLKGDPPVEISKLANTGYDLIIIGSRGKNPISSLVMGSVSSRVLQDAKCPVLVVK